MSNDLNLAPQTSRSRLNARPTASPARSAETRRRWISFGVIAFLFLLTPFFHGAVFGDFSGYRAALGGVFVGLTVAALSYWGKLGIVATAGAAVLGYVAFGGVFALPQTAIGGVIPSAETLTMLAVQAVTAWKDLLTLQPPASAFVGPSVLPYLVGVLTSTLGGALALRIRHAEFALAPLVANAVVGIIWGMRGDANLLVAIIMTVVSVLWAAWHANDLRYGEMRLAQADDAQRKRQLRGLGALAMVLTGALAAGLAAPYLVGGHTRWVARDYVVPELDLEQFPSPLANYRSYIDQGKDDTYLTVSSLDDGERVRLAVLDAYDGIVYDIAPQRGENGFVHTGEQTQELPPEGDVQTRTRTIQIGEYAGPWIPGSGQMTRIEFSGERTEDLQRSFYYNDYLRSALVMNGVQTGDSFQVTSIAEKIPEDDALISASLGAIPMDPNTNVPAVVGDFAKDVIADEINPLRQARTIEAFLQTKGYYSDGTDRAAGRAGHRADRILAMLDNTERMVGDDEQYAVLMALMVRELGMPARVVLGFYPETYTGGEVAMKGTDAHVWVEINFAGHGWVTFDPTPERDRLLQSADPKSHPDPSPRVIQPPEPVDEPEKLEWDEHEEKDTKDPEEEAPNLWLRWVVAGGAGFLLLVLPFLVIILWKLIRTFIRKRRGGAEDRVARAWDDVLDTARDYRYPVDPLATRHEQARALAESFPDKVNDFSQAAYAADRSVFALGAVDDSTVENAWALADQAKAKLRPESRWRRLRGKISASSLKGSRHRKPTAGKRPAGQKVKATK